MDFELLDRNPLITLLYYSTEICLCKKSECRIYVDIMTGEGLSSSYLANMELVYWSVRSSIRSKGDWVKRV